MSFENREDAERVASATECTGLVPALHESGDEDERALYDVQPTKRPRRGKTQSERRT